MPRGLARPILTATLVAGTLDILAAAGLTLFYGGAPTNMLRRVASGPFAGATDWGAGGAALGLATHFALMAVMAAVFMIAAARWRALWTRPLLWGIAYGLATYVVMNLIVVPLRWPEAFPPRFVSVATQLFCHIVLVGIPIALIAARHFRGRSAFAR
ncbi:MAG: hypothetical protein QOG13_1037 [Sphingomonadales bacterium]|jgi:hypothetical protein|nr:hypothetical protein [Sphingomonadales bacterium]MEA3045544.1 hypothetical protein [Sphingomonadales bacterium]